MCFCGENLRIISLTPATTEILFALGLGQNIVGDTTYCNYPPAAQKKEKVGAFSNPDIEKIISLKPDIVFTTDEEQNRLTRSLKKLDIKTFQVAPRTINELISSIKDIGKLTNKVKEANTLAEKIQKKVNYYRLKTKNLKKIQECLLKYIPSH